MRLRYSFKTLLIVFTVLAAGIGMFAIRWHSARRQRDAVSALQTAHASIWYEYQTWKGEPVMNSSDPLDENPRNGSHTGYNALQIWLGQQFGRDFVFDVVHVSAFSPLKADVVARLADLRKLNHLRLQISKGFDDAAWQSLLHCQQVERLTLIRDAFEPTRRLAGLHLLPNLKKLQIELGAITVEDAREIAQLSGLRELTLSTVDVTDAALQPLAELKNLEHFELLHRGLGREVTAEGAAFVTHLSRLTSLTLGRMPSLNDAVFTHLASLPRLESLNLDQAAVTGVEIQRLTSLRQLKSLNLVGTQVDDEAMHKLSTFTQLESLDLHGTHVTDAGLQHVGALKNLRRLNVCGLDITDRGIAELSRLSYLEELLLARTKLTDAGLAHLAKLHNLQSLWLGPDSHVTKAGLADLKTAIPKCTIYQH